MLNVIEKLILKQEDYPHLVAARLCAYSGKSPSTIDRYRKNPDSIIDARDALKIAKFFEVTVDQLYEESTPVQLGKTLKKRGRDAAKIKKTSGG